MSAYVTCKTIYKDRDSLVAALKDIGYGTVEIHDEPQSLYGYHGDVRPEKAHVIVRRAHVGSASNDIGFVRQSDGTYGAIVSVFDQGNTLTVERQNKLKARYAYRQTVKVAKAKGYNVVSEKSKDGKTKIVLRRFA